MGGGMASSDRHLVVLGCGLVGVMLLAFGSGFAAASWFTAAPPRLSGVAAMAATPAGDCPASPVLPASTHAAGNPGADAAEAPTAAMADAGAIPTKPAGAAGIRVQVGNFLDPRAAGAVTERLNESGYQAVIEQRTDASGSSWYAPVLGVYDERADAAEAALEVARQTGLEPRLVAAGGGVP